MSLTNARTPVTTQGISFSRLAVFAIQRGADNFYEELSNHGSCYLSWAILLSSTPSTRKALSYAAWWKTTHTYEYIHSEHLYNYHWHSKPCTIIHHRMAQ